MLPEIEVDRRRSFLPDLAGKYSMQLQTTTACNAACIFCPHKDTWKKVPVKYMSDKLLDKIIDQMQGMRFYRISPYLQNEPLCDPRIFDIVKKISQSLVFDQICFSANPVSLTMRNACRIADAFANVGHEIRISFHGVDKSSFENNMNLEFEQSLKNVIYFMHIAYDAGLCVTVKGLGFGRGDPISGPGNFGEQSFLDFWESVCEKECLPSDYFYFKYSGYHDRSQNVKDTEREENKKRIREDLDGFYCTRVDRWFHITYDGKLIICCNDYHREVVLGDISCQSIEEIRDSYNYKSIVRKVCGKEASESNFICKRCASPGG